MCVLILDSLAGRIDLFTGTGSSSPLSVLGSIIFSIWSNVGPVDDDGILGYFLSISNSELFSCLEILMVI